MVRRSTPQSKIDERAYPVRVKYFVPEKGFGNSMEVLHSWLDTEIGRGNYAWHGGGAIRGFSVRDMTTLYFRTPQDAAKFGDAFPWIEVADHTMSVSYTSPFLPFGRRGES